MPVIPLLLDPYLLVRRLIPKRYQRYHSDWQFYNRKEFNDLGTDIIPLVSLFGSDVIFLANADAVVEVATNPQRFPKALKLYSAIPGEVSC
jgi:hypothetical protein